MVLFGANMVSEKLEIVCSVNVCRLRVCFFALCVPITANILETALSGIEDYNIFCFYCSLFTQLTSNIGNSIYNI